MRNTRSKIDQLETGLKKGKKTIEERSKSKELELSEISEGERVWVKSAKDHGLIEKIKGQDRIEVKINSLKLETNLHDLEPPKRKEKENSGGYAYDAGSNQIEMELNVRGQTTREALREVDQYLDRLIRSDRKKGRILHGKGTGKLRREIRKHLRDISAVSRCYSPSRSEGGSGVTVVEIK